MKGLKIAIALAMMVMGCDSPKDVRIPEHIIPQDSMVLILTDMHLLEGAKMGRRMMGDTLRIDAYYQKLFEKYHIDKKKLDSSYVFYSTHPQIMDEIYNGVLEKLNAIEVAPKRWEEEVEE